MPKKIKYIQQNIPRDCERKIYEEESLELDRLTILQIYLLRSWVRILVSEKTRQIKPPYKKLSGKILSRLKKFIKKRTLDNKQCAKDCGFL